MSNTFDPYSEWLSISSERRPLDHYTILGLERFESDKARIQSAADERMGLLRKFQSGPRGRHVQQVIGEVTRAKLCLLDPERKRIYDDDLKLIEENESMGSLLEPSTAPLAPPVIPPPLTRANTSVQEEPAIAKRSAEPPPIGIPSLPAQSVATQVSPADPIEKSLHRLRRNRRIQTVSSQRQRTTLLLLLAIASAILAVVLLVVLGLALAK